MKILGNFTQSLIPYRKHLIYRIYILSIVLYNFSLWYFNKVSLLYPLKELRKIQYKAALWILDTFHTSPTLEIEVIGRLIPIHLDLQKLNRRYQLRISTLSSNHAIKLLLESRHINSSCLLWFNA